MRDTVDVAHSQEWVVAVYNILWRPRGPVRDPVVAQANRWVWLRKELSRFCIFIAILWRRTTSTSKWALLTIYPGGFLMPGSTCNKLDKPSHPDPALQHLLFSCLSRHYTFPFVQMTVHTRTASPGHVAAYFARPTVETCLAGPFAPVLLQPDPELLLLIGKIHIALDRSLGCSSQKSCSLCRQKSGGESGVKWGLMSVSAISVFSVSRLR